MSLLPEDNPQFTPPLDQPNRGIDASLMHGLWIGGVIGTKEFRGWLAAADPDFALVRDPDIDNEIDAKARERAYERRSQDNAPDSEES